MFETKKVKFIDVGGDVKKKVCAPQIGGGGSRAAQPQLLVEKIPLFLLPLIQRPPKRVKSQ